MTTPRTHRRSATDFPSRLVRMAYLGVGVGAAFSGLAVLYSQAANILWVGSDGNFDSIAATAGWNGPKPGTADNAIVNDGAVVTINANETVNDLRAGDGANATGTYLQTTGTLRLSGGWLRLGTTAGSTGTYTLSGGSLSNTIATNRFNIGEQNGGTGFLTVNGTGTLNNSVIGTTVPQPIKIGGGGNAGTEVGTGTVTVADAGTINNAGELWVGQTTGSTGTVNVNGGSLNVHNWVAIGRAGATGTINFTAGAINHDGVNNAAGRFSIGSGGGVAGNGTMNQTGGIFTDTTPLLISELGTANYNISGGTVNANGGVVIVQSANGVGTLTLQNGTGLTGALANGGGNEVFTTTTITLGNAGTGAATVNLNGGTLALNNFIAGAGTGAKAINFNGGLLQARTTSGAFLGGTIAANILAGGARIDSNGNAITIATALLHGAASGATDGGLTKIGAGTLTVTGANTYLGPTTLNGGELAMATIGNGGASGTLGASTSDAANLIFNGGTLRFTGTSGATDRNFTINAGKTGFIDVSNPAGVLTLTGGAAATTGVLAKIGNGTLVVNGTNLHTGGTTAAGGVLALSGAPTGAFSVSGGRIAPVYQAEGTLTLPTLSFGTSGGVDFEFGAGNDVINVSGAGGLTLGKAALNLYQTGTTSPFTTNGTYTLFGYNGSFTGPLLGAFSIANSQVGKFYGINNNAGASTIELSIGDSVVTAWNTDGGGSWNTAGNWTNGVPNSAGAAVTFGQVLTAANSPATVTLDGSKTVGSITFDNANSYNVTPGSGGTLKIDNGIGTAQIGTTSGMHSITAPILLVNPTNLSAAAASTLTLSGNITGGQPISATGGGTVVLTGNNTLSGTTAITAGTLEISANALNGVTAIVESQGAILRVSGGGPVTLPTMTLDIGAGTGTAISGLANGTSDFALEVTTGTAVTLAGGLGNNGGSFIKRGSGSLTLTGAGANILSTVANIGTVIQDGSVTLNGGAAATYAVTNGELAVGDNTPNQASLTLASGTLNVGTFASVARGNGTTGLASSLNITGGTLNAQFLYSGYANGIAGYSTNPVIAISGTGVANASGAVRFSESAGASTVATLSDAAQLFSGGNLEVGYGGRAKLSIGVGTTVNTNQVILGGVAGGAGAIVNLGTLLVRSGANVNNFALGNAAGAYGYYLQDSPVNTTVQEIGIGAAGGGSGVFEVRAGSVTSGNWLTVNRTNAANATSGMLLVQGGTLNLPNVAGHISANQVATAPLYSVFDVGAGGRLAGGNLSDINLMNSGLAGHQTTLTIHDGGSVETPRIFAGQALGTAVVNFNGGKLVAQAAGNLLDTNLDGVFVYNGGVTIDTQGFAVANANPLLAPTGSGIASIPVTFAGAGYLGRPIVNISDPAGIGASAVANFDETSGLLTGITITSPGVGYTSPTITLVGGGMTAAATLDVPVLGANASTGGLTKLGAGSLALTGASTFTGGTTITAGTITAGNNSALGTGAISFGTAAVKLVVSDGVTIANALNINGGTPGVGTGLIQGSGTGLSTVSGPINITATMANGGHFAGGGGTLLVTGPITSSVPVAVRAGNTVFSGGGAYTSILLSDSPKIGANNGLSVTAVADIGPSAPATFDLNGFNQELAGLTRSVAGNAATVTNSAAASTLNLNLAGTTSFTYSGAITGNVALTKSGPGTQEISGAASYAGATSVNAGTLLVSGSISGTASVAINAGGTALLGGTGDRISNTAPFTLAGGTLNTAGLSEGDPATVGLGNLSVTANSTIDFGNATGGTGSQLLFAGVGSHTTGTTLSITDWNGTANQAGGTADDRLLFVGDDTARLAFQGAFSQSEVTFNTVPGFTTVQYDAGHFEIVPIPEPSCWAILGATLGLAGLRKRCR